MFDLDTPTTSKMIVKNDIGFSLTVRIKGYTLTSNAFMSLNIRVCGSESIALALP